MISIKKSKNINKKGFTLVEILLVLVIIAIILIITVPNILEAIDANRQESGKSIEKIIEKNLELYNKDHESDLWIKNNKTKCTNISYSELLSSNPDIKLGECLLNDENSLTIVKTSNGKYKYYVGITCGKNLTSKGNANDDKYIIESNNNNDDDVYYHSNSLHCDNNFTLTAVLNDGRILNNNGWNEEGTNLSKDMVSGSKYGLLPELEEKNGNAFQGWNTEANGTGAWITEEDITTSEIDTIYAIWKNSSESTKLMFDSQEIDVLYSENTQTKIITGAHGGVGPYIYEKTSGESDIIVSSTGVISIPGSKPVGTYPLAIEIKDKVGNTTSGTITMKITRSDNNTRCPSLTPYEGTYDGKSHTIKVGNDGYGGTGWSLQYKDEGSSTWSSTMPSLKNAGTKTVRVRIIPNDSSFNSADCGESTIKINKKKLTVTVIDKTRSYGTSNPTFTYTTNGAVEGETPGFTGTLTTTANQTSNVGTYDITQGTLALTDGTGGFLKDNYTLSYTKGSLTVIAQKCGAPSSVSISTAGYVTWTNNSTSSCNAYQVKVGTGSYETATSGVDKNSDITSSTGAIPVSVIAKAPNSNYSDSDPVVETVTVIKISFASNDTNKGTVSPTSKNVISGVTITTSGNNLLINGVTSGTSTKTLATIIPSAKTGNDFSSWSKTSGNLTSSQTITATFESTLYTVSYKDCGNAEFSGTHGNNYPTNYRYGVGATLDSPTKANNTFRGYYPTSECTGTAVTSIGTTETGEKTYYAKWTSNIAIPTAENYCNTGLIYNGGNQTLVKNAGTGFTWDSTTTSGKNATNYTVKANLSSGYTWSDGSTTTKTISCSIGKKILTVTAENKSRVYGTANPTFTYTNSGAVEGETPGFTGNLTTSAATTSNVGNYDITQGTLALANGSGGFLKDNYKLSYTKGTLTVTAQKCNAPTNVVISTAGLVTWTNSSTSACTTHQVKVASGSYSTATSGVNKKSDITSATGSRSVSVIAKAPNSNYSDSDAGTATTTVYSVTLTKGTGISSVSGAGNYIKGSTVNIDATVSEGWNWSNWTRTNEGTVQTTDKATARTINNNWTYTANATRITYTITYKRNTSTSDTTQTTGTKTYGTAYSIIDNPSSWTNGTKVFLGWSTAESAGSSSTWYDPAQSYTTNAALTLYAQWYDVDSLEKAYTTYVQYGDFTRAQGSVTDVKTTTGDENTNYPSITVPSGYRNTGAMAGWATTTYLRTRTFIPYTSNIKVFHVASGTSQAYYTWNLLVKARSATTYTDDIDTRIDRLQKLQDVALEYDEIKQYYKLADDVSIPAGGNQEREYAAEDGWENIACVGVAASNATNSGTNVNKTWARVCNIQPNGNGRIGYAAAVSSVSAKIKMGLFLLETKVKTARTTTFAPTSGKGLARYNALTALNDEKSNYFPNSYIKTSGGIEIATTSYSAWNYGGHSKTVSVPSGKLLGAAAWSFYDSNGSTGGSSRSLLLSAYVNVGAVQSGTISVTHSAGNSSRTSTSGYDQSGVVQYARVLYLSPGTVTVS